MKTANQIDEQQIINDLLKYCEELRQQWELTHDLRKVSQWSFQQRESGRNIPYMSIGQTEKNSNTVLGLWAAPISRQRDLYRFFDMPMCEGIILPKYSIRMYLDEGIVFKEKLGKGKDNCKMLYQFKF